MTRRREKKRSQRVRYVGDGVRCRQDGRLFFQQRTISGRSTEGFCSAECAALSIRKNGRG